MTKTHHICPRCGKQWRCKQAEECQYWEKVHLVKGTHQCMCPPCSAFTRIPPACQEVKKVWSVS